MEIRFATTKDKSSLLQEDDRIDPKFLNRKIRDQEYIIAVEDNRLLGLLRFEYLCSFIPYMAAIGVQEEHQRKGIGRALFNFWTNYLKKKGHSFVLTSSDHSEAKEWHKKVGFIPCGKINFPSDFQSEPEEFFYKTID